MKLIIFGAGMIAQRYYHSLQENPAFEGPVEVVCFLDNNEHKQKQPLLGLPVKAPAEVTNLPYDKIVVTISDVEEAKEQLLSLGVAKGCDHRPAQPQDDHPGQLAERLRRAGLQKKYPRQCGRGGRFPRGVCKAAQ